MGNNKAEQVEVEQRIISEMYARLDAEIDSNETSTARAKGTPAEGPEAFRTRAAELSRLADRTRTLRSAEKSLCFGRIDEGTDEHYSLHIGRIGLLSETEEILLVDWRAKAAQPFYSATAAHPMGLRRRRHLRIDDRDVVDLTDEILDGSAPIAGDEVGDGPLMSVLNGPRTGQMREAAATLQKEQDQIVRSANRGITVVDGGPGTGKTIVALHRAAFVLYEFPLIAKRGVLVYGPNQRFLNYISDVLPSLGENDVQLATLSDVVGVEPAMEAPEELARFLGRADLAEALARWVKDYEPHSVPLEIATSHGTVALDSQRVDSARRSANQGSIGHNRAREVFIGLIVDEIVTELERQTENEISNFENELKKTAGIDLDRLFAGDDSASAPGSSEMDIDWENIRAELLEDPGIERALDSVWPHLQAENVVRGALGDISMKDKSASGQDVSDLAMGSDAERRGWSESELALLDEARTLVDGPPETTYGHIIVDEAQELSEMQWRMLMRRCPARSMTIVGDLAQAGPTSTVRCWKDALGPFVDGRFDHHTLTINYRTTAEILGSTRALLASIAPEQHPSQSIRHGETPTTIVSSRDDVATAIDGLIARLRQIQPEGLIGLIAAAARADALHEVFATTDVSVVAAPRCRGLEFDSVIVVAPEEIRSAGLAGERDLYVAHTRATQRLVSLKIEGSDETGPRPAGG